ncbi:peptidylprolyl isomerase [Pararobbsia silviterrae]|uniref:Peptidyl-prolyl cis-trans isomerase n=1 Tax=Pararobbsia silviterrae TaxID=1792498 RepID=A0A494XZR2_9BURK|nr:peptidylprolyl isomerase [Pararobbsia silviterrae]RKP54529.1 peptidyl-prolyl cis-trans isomerase [Pararobbsia silviterrae]
MKRFFPALASCAVAVSFALSSVAAQANPDVLFKTSLGDFTVELDPARAPKTVDNFLTYVKEGHYNGTVFHRVIPGFMVQGGGFTTDLKEKPTHAPIAIESRNGLKNLTGTIAMARTNDPNSATSQFFINVVDNASLDFPQPDGYGYAVFGKVVSGMDVVKKIEIVPTHTENMMQDVPRVPVVIESATVVGH